MSKNMSVFGSSQPLFVPDVDASCLSDRVVSRKKGVMVYAKNPFWKSYEIVVGQKRITIAGGLVVSPETGESQKYGGVHRVEYVDQEKFMKVYAHNIHHIFNLTKPAQSVLMCVMRQVQETPNADGLWLGWLDVKESCERFSTKISLTAYRRALKEMIEKGFIAEGEKSDYYWFNPHLFFNGDRMAFVDEYRRMPVPKSITKG